MCIYYMYDVLEYMPFSIHRFFTAILMVAELLQQAHSQAPFDSDTFCTSSSRFQAQQDIIPDSHFVLLDSYAYTNLLGNSGSTWVASELDGDDQTVSPNKYLEVVHN